MARSLENLQQGSVVSVLFPFSDASATKRRPAFLIAPSDRNSQDQGKYIAFENGLVLDSDSDDRQLMPRLYAKYGHRDIFVKYVCDPEPQLSASAAGHLFPIQ